MPYMSASMQILDYRLRIIHIPLQLYPHFVQAILALILPLSPEQTSIYNSERGSYTSAGSASSPIKDFINISVTPIECSVVCSVESVEKWFKPIIDTLGQSTVEDVKIADDEFLAIQVEGEGLNAGQRVLDLTSPLALAGISILFISTYFSDYILVPEKSRANVVKALHRHGFVFEKLFDSFISSPTHHRHSSSASSFDFPPQTPPITTLGEVQTGTFARLRSEQVQPQVNYNTRLVLCAGNRYRAYSKSPGNLYGPGHEYSKFHFGLVKCLVSKPHFLSVTLTDNEAPSLLLQVDMLSMFDTGTEVEDVLLGGKEDILIPIVLDLRGLPENSTGIVYAVASKLAGGTQGSPFDDIMAVDMSYLSTARAGNVMVAERDIARAVKALGM